MLKIAHRGASGYEPENTLRSFKKAIELKSDAIELDVQLTKDNKLVVIHDDNVKRTTNGKGKVSEKTLKELKKLDAGKGEKIPTLEEVFNLVKRKVKINIGLKGKDTAKPASDLIKKYVREKKWKYSDFFVSSFDFSELEEFYRINKSVRIGVLFERSLPLQHLNNANKIKAYSINPPKEYVTKKFVKEARKRSLKIFVWTANKKSDIEKLKDLAVDGIISNFPDRIA